MGMPIDANWTQEDYAFYEDGTESGSTIVGSAGAQQTLEVDTTYFCRLAISDTTGSNASGDGALRCIWQYNLAGGGWTDVGASTPLQFASSSNVTDGGTTTNRQPTGTGTFNAGRIYESANDTAIVYTTPGTEVTSHTEVLLVFQLDSAQVSDGQEVLVRCINNVDGTTPTVYPGTYTNADIDVNETVPSAITGSAAVAFADPTTVIDGLTPSFAGSSAFAFTDSTDITPSPGVILGSASVVFDDPSTTIADINVGPDPIVGSAAIVFTDPATDLNGLTPSLAGSAAAAVTSASDITPSIGKVRGHALPALTSVADITPSVGDLAGSVAIISGDLAKFNRVRYGPKGKALGGGAGIALSGGASWR